MPERSIHTAAVIGTGMMGPGIAVSLALGRVAATLISRNEEGARAGLAKARAQLDLLTKEGLAAPDDSAWALENLHASVEFDKTIAPVDLVIESAPEDLTFKRELFARMDALTRPEAILASNTSGLSITAIARDCPRPERVITAHFWNPPYLMRLVEIVRGEKTAEDVVTTLRSLLERCGKAVVVLKKDRPGQLGNRLQHALVREAIHIVEEGIATADDVDLAAKAGFGLRLPVYGIFEHQDAVGLDLVLAIQDYVNQDLCREPGAAVSLKKMVENGELGVKSGSGFHDWSKKNFEEIRERRDRFLLQFMKSEFAREE